ncbi:MAG TPA: 4Fe-4S dicluster domain-containing protein [Ignavibacteriaceae bacterium]|nr:4Fe-4S dicluster domain-containing protein [Ignavibacteriaceae bacterium]
MNIIQIEPFKVYSHNNKIETLKKSGLAAIAIGFLFFLISLTGISSKQPLLFFFLSFGLVTAGSILYFAIQVKEAPAGIKNNRIFFDAITSRKSIAWILGIVLTGFYILLYWYPGTLQNLVNLINPLSYLLRGQPADRWVLYGTFYTMAVIIMAIRMIVKYRNNRYQILRSISVSFFQLGFSFIIPGILVRLNKPEFYFNYFWPLKFQYLFPDEIKYLTSSGGALGYFMIFWGAAMLIIATPILTYFFGKRWYCSWVCGCGGLAETAGDPFRQNSDKSLKAWKLERISIHSVLVFVVITTGLLWINSASNGKVLGSVSQVFAEWYGFVIGALFSGIIGVGFYPIFGSRVWCRFGCPMAATLGMLQKYFSRFRITTNGGQCISCGNCSTYCEMGIDVKWYAQRGQNIIRSSCVGCGVCSAVCPRGVLKLENLPRAGRYSEVD